MNEYIKNDKRQLIFDFCFFGKIGDWNRNSPKMLHTAFNPYLLIVKWLYKIVY